MTQGTKAEQDRQRSMNPVTLERLAANGSDLSRPHRIVNVFHVFQKSGIGPMLQALERLGLFIGDRGSHQRYETTEYWKIEASTNLIPSLNDLNTMTDRCVEVAHRQKAGYDGWFTEVVSPG